jgi:hypothetical protein
MPSFIGFSAPRELFLDVFWTVLCPGIWQRLRSTFALVFRLIWAGFFNDRGGFDFVSLERPTDPQIDRRPDSFVE